MTPMLNDLRDWIRLHNRRRLARRRQQRERHGVPRQAAPMTPVKLPVALQALIDPATLVLPVSEQPQVSILVAAYGQLQVTLRCLASIAANPPQVPFEVIVVEDASGEPDADQVGRVRGVRFLNQRQNQGYLLSCNAGARMARGRWLLLLNNDTQLMPGAVDALADTFARHPRAGLVGAKLVYPDGRLQEAGGIVWSDATGANIGRGRHPDEPEFNTLREVDYCSAAAVLVDLALWRQLGGFDERYVPAYCEDSDFAMQVRAAGRLVLVQPEAVVVHLEGVSCGTDDNPGIKKHQYLNMPKLRQKWQWVLERDHLPSEGAHHFRGRWRAKGRPVMLVVDNTMIQPDHDAGSRTIATVIDTLLAQGWRIVFWPMDPTERPQPARALRQRGVMVQDGPLRPGFQDWIREHGPQLDAVLLSRPEVAHAWLGMIRHACTARVVFYGHDIHHERLLAQATRCTDGSARAAAALLAEQEQQLWQRADVVLYPSQDEVDTVRRQAPGSDVRRLQAYAFTPREPRHAPPARPVLQFVAGFGHPPNVDAAVWLVQEIAPRLWQRHPGLLLRLVGSNPTPAVQALAGPDVEVTGWVSDERLAALYEEASVAIAPLRFGAGVKLKVVEALAQALPVVTTPVGVQGLPGVGAACAVHDQPEALADAVLRLLDDPARWRQASAAASRYIAAHYSARSLADNLAEVFGRPALPGALLAADQPAGTTVVPPAEPPAHATNQPAKHPALPTAQPPTKRTPVLTVVPAPAEPQPAEAESLVTRA